MTNTPAIHKAPTMHWGLLLTAAAMLMITMGARQTTGLFIAPIHESTGVGIAAISLALAVGQFEYALDADALACALQRYARYLPDGIAVESGENT